MISALRSDSQRSSPILLLIVLLLIVLLSAFGKKVGPQSLLFSFIIFLIGLKVKRQKENWETGHWVSGINNSLKNKQKQNRKKTSEENIPIERVSNVFSIFIMSHNFLIPNAYTRGTSDVPTGIFPTIHRYLLLICTKAHVCNGNMYILTYIFIIFTIGLFSIKF